MRKSLYVTVTAICAALYAVGSYATSCIESPWGIGQFRPAIVIPAFFAIVFGPWVGGIGAALGTFIQSIFRYGHPWLTLVSGPPANFIAFFLLGYMLYKKFTWTRFIVSSIAVLIAANFACAVGVLAYFLFTGVFPPNLPFMFYLGFTVGLTLWWYITMLPFTLLLTPVLIKAASLIIPHFIPTHIVEASLKSEVPSKMFSGVLVLSGIGMVLVGLATFLPGSETLVVAYKPAMREIVLSGIRLMFLLTGGGCTVTGAIFYILKLFSR
ncbi:MAG: hypothetical protein DRJ38_02830 [Thermoprotei archaeon]|nr:MAG: hypothetical protein DRJ38_02830 [Thermoprotei archaeon]